MHRVFACAGLLSAIPAATPTVADETADLAQELANPLAKIISVPFQLNYDDNLGLADDRSRDTLNIQPVVAFQLGDGRNLITRTIIPFVWPEVVVPGTSQGGFGDVLVSAWFSPVTARDLTCGIGAVARSAGKFSSSVRYCLEAPDADAEGVRFRLQAQFVLQHSR